MFDMSSVRTFSEYSDYYPKIQSFLLRKMSLAASLLCSRSLLALLLGFLLRLRLLGTLRCHHRAINVPLVNYTARPSRSMFSLVGCLPGRIRPLAIGFRRHKIGQLRSEQLC